MSYGLLSSEVWHPVDMICPVNWLHPLNTNLHAWYMCVPGQTGGARWMNLCRPGELSSLGVLTNMDPVTDWVRGSDRTGGYAALDFDGSNDEINCGTLSPGTESRMTLTGWVYRGLTTHRSIFGWGDSAGDRLFFLHDNDSTQYFMAEPGYSFSGNTGVGWRHISLCYDGNVAAATRMRGYINAVEEVLTVGVALPVTTTPTGSYRIARDVADGIFMTGRGDDFRVYKGRTLQPVEVKQLYDLSQRGYPGLLNRIKYSSVIAQDSGGQPIDGGYQESLRKLNTVERNLLSAGGRILGVR